jgi:hypothetical protein
MRGRGLGMAASRSTENPAHLLYPLVSTAPGSTILTAKAEDFVGFS